MRECTSSNCSRSSRWLVEGKYYWYMGGWIRIIYIWCNITIVNVQPRPESFARLHGRAVAAIGAVGQPAHGPRGMSAIQSDSWWAKDTVSFPGIYQNKFRNVHFLCVLPESTIWTRPSRRCTRLATTRDSICRANTAKRRSGKWRARCAANSHRTRAVDRHAAKSATVP